MNILLSIKPIYVEEIRAELKLVELRKKFPLDFNGKIFVYESAPTKRIVGYIIPKSIEEMSIQNLWQKTKEINGIGQYAFLEYFQGKKTGIGIFIDRFVEVLSVEPEKIGIKHGPQSYMYLDNEQTKVILGKKTDGE